MQDYSQAWAFVAALAGDPNTAVIDWRCLHDVDKGAPGHARRGTLPEWWAWLTQMNDAGHGVFCAPAMMDGAGRELANVSWLRAHYVDLDAGDAGQQYQRAAAYSPAPGFAVASSPNKWHIYWPLAFAYSGNERFTLIQRKLRQTFNGDRNVIDPTRVMRVPGTWHRKGEPHLVTCHAMPGYGQPCTAEQLEQSLATVNVIDGGSGRHELGEPELAAPSLEWLEYGLKLCDPNDLTRAEWLGLSAAFKQAGWSLAPPEKLLEMFMAWCARYEGDDPAENLKLWASVRNSELGWPSFRKRVPSLMAATTFGGVQQVIPANDLPTPDAVNTPPMPSPPALDCTGEYLTHLEQAEWFKGCIFVVNRGDMLAPDGRFLGANQFNAKYGGKKFIIDTNGKLINEAWQAATRSTLWTVPKVDHTRFVPSRAYGEILTDDLERTGVNVYRPATVRRVTGDVSPFLRHIAALLPEPQDQRTLLDYLAHNARFPGFKIPWAPVIQSTEGAGKGVMKAVMMHVMGRPYVYFPNAKELTNSGSQFNAWMRHKLFILADEIKVDDRRDLIEVLKPMISEEIIEVQGKGHDQDLEDNFSNWLFFTNWKDAIPITANGRRFAIMYSPLQTAQDLLDRQMGDAYFKALYDWLKADGAAAVADWLMNYPIECGAIPMRAPDTTSTADAIAVSRGPLERMIMEAVEDGLPGFRGGWISATMVATRARLTGAVRTPPGAQTVATVLEGLGYRPSGRSPRPYFAEDKDVRAHLFHWARPGDVEQYGRAQGWE